MTQTNITSKNTAKLTGLFLDGQSIPAFRPEQTLYTVSLPDGRPRIPQITATAEEGAALRIDRAVFPDGVTEASARVTVTRGGEKQTYTVTFAKDPALGFVLQYGDRYPFVPNYPLADGEVFTFASSDEAIVTVDETGRLTVNKVSDTPITVTASVGGRVVDSLTVSHTDRAQTALFLITGQSNACGTFDDNEYSRSVEPLYPPAGVALFLSVPANYDAEHPVVRDVTAEPTWGFAAPLAKRWYELTGEKSFLLQSAVGGSPIEAWIKDGDIFGITYGGHNLYNNTLDAYRYVIDTYGREDSPYEFIRTGYFWVQGETIQSAKWTGTEYNFAPKPEELMTGEEYYDVFMSNHRNFVREMGVEFASIGVVRALYGVCCPESQKSGYLTDLIPIRAAQYALHNNEENEIFFGSRVGEIALPKYSTSQGVRNNYDVTAEGFGYMGIFQIHYAQAGYNAQGKTLAENTFAKVSPDADRSVKAIEVLACNGRTRLDENVLITVLSETRSYQFGAIALPLYADNAALTFAVTEGAEHCSVTPHGKVVFSDDAPTDAAATVTITHPASGLTRTLRFHLK